MYLTYAIKKENGRALIVDQDGATSDEATEGVPIRVDRGNPFKLSSTPLSSSAEVRPLPRAALMPTPRIQAMMTGPPEVYRDEIGFTDPMFLPKKTTIAMWLEYKDGSPRLHKFIVGGNYTYSESICAIMMIFTLLKFIYLRSLS